jgi:hypothetical protein
LAEWREFVRLGYKFGRLPHADKLLEITIGGFEISDMDLGASDLQQRQWSIVQERSQFVGGH